MFQQLFRNMTDVVKNLLILNVLVFLAKIILQNRGIDLDHILGMHYVESAAFEPYQAVTYMFMHGGLFHIFFNMFALVIFGSMLERVWGPKRFLIFYFITGIGALVLHVLVQYFQIQSLMSKVDPQLMTETIDFLKGKGLELIQNGQNTTSEPYGSINALYNVPMVGASGAIFGILLAFAMYFPNTKLQLLFPPIPIKAKYFVGIYVLVELYMGYSNNTGDNVAHFAHLGGALFGLILVLIWKKDRTNFY